MISSRNSKTTTTSPCFTSVKVGRFWDVRFNGGVVRQGLDQGQAVDLAVRLNLALQ